MALEITGELFRGIANRMMEAIELIPEDKRDFKIWERSFKDAEGADVAKAAMTPAELAADTISAMAVFSAVAAGEFRLTEESFGGEGTWLQANEGSCRLRAREGGEGRATA